MNQAEATRLEHARRWLRPDWQRWLRPDWERFVRPDQREAKRREIAERKAAFERPAARRLREQQAHLDLAALTRDEQWEAECAERKFRSDIAWLRFEFAMGRLLSRKAGFRQDQPRVPAGTSDGGRWTSSGGETVNQSDKVQLAASEGLPIGPRAMAKLLSQIAKRAIEAYRSENLLYGLFDQKRGSVSLTTIEGKDIFGTNRGSQLWDRADEQDWRRLRDSLAEKYPELRQENMGELPINALTHSETNVIARTARQYGGNLAGRHIEVFTDQPMCTSCPTVLPYVTREYGSPTVTFTYVGPKGPGKSRTIENGDWKAEGQP